MCEVLNAKTVEGRDKPIISALEFMREYLMQRIVNVIRKIGRCNGPLTPSPTKILAENKKDASRYTVKWSGGPKYQVSRGGQISQRVVDVVEMVCSCRQWEITGIPCRHAVAVNWDMALHGQQVGPPESWVNQCYWLDTWKAVYSHRIEPINGRDLWPKSNVPTTLTPPLHHKSVGRPKKKRRKDQVELQDELERAGKAGQRKGKEVEHQSGKLTRKWKSVNCKKCGGKGHNIRTCGKVKKGKQPKKSDQGNAGNQEGTSV